MSIFDALRKALLGYLPENTGASCHQRTIDHFGFLTVSGAGTEIIPLAFKPHDMFAEFVDDDNPPSCAPLPTDTCSAHHAPDHSLKIIWSVSSERKIRWKVTERST